MAVSLPNGSIISVASGYLASANITALSNAAEAVATAANTLSVGDIIEITCGWSRLTDKIVRVKSATGADFVLEGYDTQLTTIYPAGSGVGSFREISGWTQIKQITNTQSNGGEQQFQTYQFLEGDAQKRIPTFKNAAGINLTIAYDKTDAGYQVLLAANEDRLPRALKVALPNGGVLLYNAYISVSQMPTMTINELLSVEATLSLLNEPVRY